MTRLNAGFFAIGIEAAKTPENVGGLWRSAQAFGASYIFTVGHRYPDRCQPTDTSKAWRNIPLVEFDDVDDLVHRLPRGARLIGVDNVGEPRPLVPYQHPERAVYVLGAEDRGLSGDMQDVCERIVEIPTKICLNVATAGSILLYDRISKSTCSLLEHSAEQEGS